MIDIQRLRVFRSVVASGSVQAAADNLGMTSSAVSQHLSALARETGLILFQRQGRGIVPTPAALVLDERTEELMAQLDAVDDVIADLRDGRSGRVTIGHFASVGVSWMPRLVHRLVEEMPGVVIDLVLTETGAHGALPDVDVTLDPADGTELSRTGYRRIELATDAFVVALRADHPLAAGSPEEPIALVDLRGETLISNDAPQSVGHRIVVAACAAAGFRPRFAIQVEDFITALGFVELGLGVTVLPTMATRLLPRGVVTRHLRSPEPQRRLVLMVRDSGVRNRAAERAVQIIEDLAATPMPAPTP